MYSQKHGKEGVYKEFEESYIFHILYRYCFIYNTHNMQSAMVVGGGGGFGVELLIQGPWISQFC